MYIFELCHLTGFCHLKTHLSHLLPYIWTLVIILNASINLNFAERFLNSGSGYHSVLTQPLQNKPDPEMFFSGHFSL